MAECNAVQLAVPLGDDGQLMSGGSGGPRGRPAHVQWLWCPMAECNTVQLAIPIGDDCQLMSGGSGDPPSYNPLEKKTGQQIGFNNFI